MTKHLAEGSTEPPLSPGQLRLYGMRFCPFDHRVHLVLLAKDILHDTVFINLKNKPDWFLDNIPSGKVPGLAVDGETLYESLIIADYLDERYPKRPLHNKDPLQKAKDKILIANFEKVIGAFYKLVLSSNPELEEFEAIVLGLEPFEKEIAQRGTPFFAGKEPGMVDYMIWPWFERLEALHIMFGSQFEISKGKFKHLVNWISEMMEDKAVKKYFLSPDICAKYLKSYRNGTPDYDLLV